jgi:hypothetical protein
VIFIIGYVVVKVISILDGLIIYTKYHDCDPVITKVRKLIYVLIWVTVLATQDSFDWTRRTNPQSSLWLKNSFMFISGKATPTGFLLVQFEAMG